MDIDFLLLFLRFLSSLLLIGFVATLFALVWRDLRTTARVPETARQHGYLEALTTIDGQMAELGIKHPLLSITTIGRAPTNTIVIADTFASSEHATVVMRNGQWWLEDKRSRNGTLLNGERLAAATVITDGDCISIGQVTLKLVLKEQ